MTECSSKFFHRFVCWYEKIAELGNFIIFGSQTVYLEQGVICRARTGFAFVSLVSEKVLLLSSDFHWFKTSGS